MKNDNQAQETMSEFELWSLQRIRTGREEGIEIGENKCLNYLVTYLIDRSKQEGKPLSMEEATREAKEILHL